MYDGTLACIRALTTSLRRNSHPNPTLVLLQQLAVAALSPGCLGLREQQKTDIHVAMQIAGHGAVATSSGMNVYWCMGSTQYTCRRRSRALNALRPNALAPSVHE